MMNGQQLLVITLHTLKAATPGSPQFSVLKAVRSDRIGADIESLTTKKEPQTYSPLASTCFMALIVLTYV